MSPMSSYQKQIVRFPMPLKPQSSDPDKILTQEKQTNHQVPMRRMSPELIRKPSDGWI